LHRIVVAVSALFLATAAPAQDPPAWTEPTPPFRVVGDVYYVGTKGLAAYLIASSQG
jgi:metallo-beta-lactamase class B